MKDNLNLLAFTFVILSGHIAQAQSGTSNIEPSIKLNHIALYVSDLKKSTAFYENILYLKQIPEPFHDGLHTWFTLGPAGHLHLIQTEPADIRRHKYDHLCFSVESIDDFIANLDKHKIEYTNWPGTAKAPTVRVDGVKQIYFVDPDGHFIEINDDKSVKN
jgi:lactoylglutathione lyase